jgi:hypothetical protein
MFLIGVVALLLGGGLIYGFQFTRVGFKGSREGFQFTRVGGAREGFKDWFGSKSDDSSSESVCTKCKKLKRTCKCSARNYGSDSGYDSESDYGSGSGSRSGSGSGSGSRSGSNFSYSSGSNNPSMVASPSVSVSSVVPAPVAPCPRTVEPDLSKYILKSQVPSTNSLMPDMSNYMLKTECPPVPDLSKYVLKSSIPKPQPVIVDNSSCMKEAGECPPCPRPRCPEVKCPAPIKCAPPAPCPRPVCPPTVVKCKSEEQSGSTVRPFLAPLNMGGFGMA